MADEIADDSDHPQCCNYSWIAFLNMNSAQLVRIEEHDSSGSFNPRSVVTGGGHGRRAEDELLRYGWLEGQLLIGGLLHDDEA